MTRTKATVSLFVFCALLVPLLLAPGPLAAKTHATKSRGKPVAAKSTKTVKTAKPATKVAKPAVVMPLPDRNPNRAAMTAAASPPEASADATAAIAAQPLPHEVPEASAAETEANASGIPVPDRNPERPASESLVAAPDPAVLAPVPVVNAPAPKPAPSGAYAAILKPLLDYQLSDSDAANLKDAFSASFRGDDAGSHEAVSRIKDSAARKLATWFEYRNGDFDASAEAIESFRLANPDWPGQEELRGRAEIALFLADASPEKVRAFFGNSTPLTGAGKAALAGAFMKENNEPAARELVVSAWRDYQLNLAVEKKILARYGSMLTAEDHQARIDKLLFPDNKATAEAALRTSKLLPAAEQKKVAARIAVVKRGANAGKLLDALPA
ncbi:MAG: hypothetical protein WAN73_03120, partial [Methyloceanibacter sp.]